MSGRSIRRCLPPATLILALAGCALQPDVADVAPVAAADERAPTAWLAARGTPFLLDAARSRITIRVYRAGRLAHLGHNHVIEVLDLSGRLKRLPAGGGVAELSFRADRMRVDDPAARTRAGEAFVQLPDAAAVAGTRRNMLGPQLLDAQRWPEIGVLARIDDLGAPSSLADLHLSLRGLGRRYRVPVSVVVTADQITVAGSVLLRQSDLGITPFSVFGGALQVRDAIEVDFQVVGRNSGAAMW